MRSLSEIISLPQVSSTVREEHNCLSDRFDWKKVGKVLPPISFHTFILPRKAPVMLAPVIGHAGSLSVGEKKGRLRVR